jgi:carbon storage regulator CsrA
MLVLSRKEGEQIVIGKDLTVTIVEIRGGRVKLGFQGPTDTRIFRAEICPGREITPERPRRPSPLRVPSAASC